MITYKIRVKADVTTVVVFKYYNVFTGLNLSLSPSSSYPSWITENLITFTPYIGSLSFSPTSLELTTTNGYTVLYFTLGGSPPLNDARLIIEVVDELYTTSDSCDKQIVMPIDLIQNENGKAKVRFDASYIWWTIVNVDDYVYIDGGIYEGYHKVLESDAAKIVLDTAYISTVSPYNNNMIVFSDDVVNIVWLNQQGGRSNYYFNQRIDKGIGSGEAKSYDNNGTIKYLNKGKITDTKVIYKTGVSDTELELISSLRNCIQAWEYSAKTNTFTPIVINNESFNTYSNKDRFNEVSIKYKLGAYKNIQNQ